MFCISYKVDFIEQFLRVPLIKVFCEVIYIVVVYNGWTEIKYKTTIYNAGLTFIFIVYDPFPDFV